MVKAYSNSEKLAYNALKKYRKNAWKANQKHLKSGRLNEDSAIWMSDTVSENSFCWLHDDISMVGTRAHPDIPPTHPYEKLQWTAPGWNSEHAELVGTYYNRYFARDSRPYLPISLKESWRIRDIARTVKKGQPDYSQFVFLGDCKTDKFNPVALNMILDIIGNEFVYFSHYEGYVKLKSLYLPMNDRGDVTIKGQAILLSCKV